MYLLYADESGSLENTGDHFVVGGLAIHESDVEAVRHGVEEIVNRYLHLPLRQLELHAQPIRAGKGIWGKIPKKVKSGLLQDISKMLGSFAPPSNRPYSLFAVAKSPDSIPSVDPLERTFEEMFLRFTQMLVRISDSGCTELGIVVADKARYESILQPIVRRWREQGTRFSRLTRLIEVPLFVDSRATRLIQMADFVAHGVYRFYEAGDDILMTPMLGGFDTAGGVIHGLVHLVTNYKQCSCPACRSRVVKAS